MHYAAKDRTSTFGLISTVLAMFGAACGPGPANEALESEDALRGRSPFGIAYSNPAGVAETISAAGAIDFTNPFFQPLGTNGRACVSCHLPADGWSLRPASARARFDQTDGLDPLFRTNDGSICENADVSTRAARELAYAPLLTKGLVRVTLPIPATAEFELVASEGTSCNDLALGLPLFRRPLPSTNLNFVPSVMWDGRETTTPGTLAGDLLNQANHATLGHAAGKQALSPEVAQSIVDFERSLSTAQIVSTKAGPLTLRGARGGPETIAKTAFELNINRDPHDPTVFTIFDAWNGLTGRDPASAMRAAVARGQEIFNHRTFLVTRANGQQVETQCSSCHLSPEVGGHSAVLFFNLGLSDLEERTPDLPLYTLRNKTTGETRMTTDPGRALITGLWSDISRFKTPTLRALAARAPYFHNGSAATLDDVVRFYDRHFSIGLTDAERADLVLFLESL